MLLPIPQWLLALLTCLSHRQFPVAVGLVPDWTSDNGGRSLEILVWHGATSMLHATFPIVASSCMSTAESLCSSKAVLASLSELIIASEVFLHLRD